MEFIIATLSSMFAAAGGWITAALTALVALGSAIFYHKAKVNKAEDQGKEDGAAIERDRIRTETDKAEQDVKRKADSIEDDVRNDRKSLLDRMRDNATDSDRKP